MRILLLVFMIAGCLLLPGCWESRQQEEKEEASPAVTSSSSLIDLKDVLQGESGTDRLHDLIGEGNVIVDFYATWCSPCQQMLPIIGQIADEYSDIKVIKVNIETFRDIADGFKVGDDTISIKSVPQFYFFKDGIIKEHFAGGREKDTLKQMINKHFNL